MAPDQSSRLLIIHLSVPLFFTAPQSKHNRCSKNNSLFNLPRNVFKHDIWQWVTELLKNLSEFDWKLLKEIRGSFFPDIPGIWVFFKAVIFFYSCIIHSHWCYITRVYLHHSGKVRGGGWKQLATSFQSFLRLASSRAAAKARGSPSSRLNSSLASFGHQFNLCNGPRHNRHFGLTYTYPDRSSVPIIQLTTLSKSRLACYASFRNILFHHFFFLPQLIKEIFSFFIPSPPYTPYSAVTMWVRHGNKISFRLPSHVIPGVLYFIWREFSLPRVFLQQTSNFVLPTSFNRVSPIFF